MRFFVASAAGLVSAHVAGSLVRRGGLSLGMRLEERALASSPRSTRLIQDFKKIRDTLDELEGVTRTHLREDRLFMRDTSGRVRSTSTITDTNRHGFFRTIEEQRRARASGQPVPADWQIQDEIQQRLVSQARRLPYELPAFYASQRLLLDPLLGTNQEPENRVNWYNPVDVLTDFVSQSTRNLAFNIMPFEAGAGAASQSWRRFMSYGQGLDDYANASKRQMASIGVQQTLDRVGARAADLFSQTIKLSSQSAGAFSAMLTEQRNQGLHITQFLSQMRSRRAQAAQEIKDNRLTGSAKWKRVAQTYVGTAKGPQGTSPLYNAVPISPARGMAAGLRAAKARWREIDDAHKAYSLLTRYGPDQFRKVYGNQPKLIESVNEMFGRGTSTLEELAGKVSTLGRGGPASPGFTGSQFYRDLINNEYARVFQRQLRSRGVSEAGAQRFVNDLNITPPTVSRAERDISERIKFGSKGISAESDKWDDVFGNMLSRFDSGDRDIIRQNVRGIMGEADSIFGNKAFREHLDTRIAQQWQLIENGILYQYGSTTLKHTKLPYEKFQDIYTNPSANKASIRFLKRRAAKETGMEMFDASGKEVSDDLVNARLIARGFDPENSAHLQAFLIKKGAIAKPWSRNARNIFGFRQLTVSEGQDRGLLTFGERKEAELRRITNRLADTDPVSETIGTFKMPGVYQSSSGQIIDLSRAKRSGRAFLDRLASDFQIPLIHTKPFSLFGYDAIKDSRNRPVMQFISGVSNQPFLGAGDDPADFYLWLRKPGLRNKGRAFAIGSTDNPLATRSIKGFFRPVSADGFGMEARQVRIAAGDLGKAELVSDQEGRSKFRRWADINPDQSNSIWGYAKRFFNRRLDVNNPYTLGTLLGGGTVKHRGQTFSLNQTTMRVIDSAGNPVEGISAADVLGGIQNIAYRQRTSGLSPVFIKAIQDHPALSHLLEGDFGLGATTVNPSKSILEGIQTPTQLAEFLELRRARDLARIDQLSPDKRPSVLRSMNSFLTRHIDAGSNPAYWDSILTGMPKGTTITTRFDEAKNDLYKYLALSNTAFAQGDLTAAMPQLLSRLTGMYSRGEISHAAFLESQSALLSLQIDAMAFKTYSREASRFENQRALAQGLLNNPEARRMFGVVGAGHRADEGGPLRHDIWAAFRRKYGVSDYEFPGAEYNPFGPTDTVLIPTFGTALARNPLRAVRSVLGSGSWDDPETFSAASVPVSHLVERTNRYFSAAGIGVNPESYSSPMDMYARGLIGKRVLPIVAGGTALFAVDRTIGGYLNPKDENGERVYRPFVVGNLATGAVHAQAAVSGLVPGGLGYEDRLQQLTEGEVPIRAGRYWPLGNSRFMGGRVQYFRPSWYRRLQAGHTYTDDAYGTPMERLAFGYDFSPLRPLDPYRFERQHYEDRPYPVTGEYFSGPWGPLTSALNMTLGKVLKPQVQMHREAIRDAMLNYMPVGEAGVYQPMLVGGGFGDAQSSANETYMQAGQFGRNTASSITTQTIASINARYQAAAGAGGPLISNPEYGMFDLPMYGPSPFYGVPNPKGYMDPRVIAATPARPTSEYGYQLRKFGYESQELAGIYGFAFGSLREGLGFGDSDFTDMRPRFASAAQAYGSTRGFWDLNLGGLGDFPLPLEGNLANLEFSEVARRFIPKERTGTQFVNPIPNQMGVDYPWLPSSDYFLNFHQSDPYSLIQEGEMRLPGLGYERMNKLHSDATGRYGMIDQHKILGDVAPWSEQYRALDRKIDSWVTTADEAQTVENTRAKVAVRNVRHDFHPYMYKDSTAEEQGMTELQFRGAQLMEKVAHLDTYFNKKFLPHRTAQEDWERNNVYGSTFPQWSCLDLETQVLSMGGWKYWDEIEEGELLWTLDPDSALGEWAPVKQVNIYPYKGDMYLFEGRTINAMVTPNHRWLTTSQWHEYKSFSFKETTELNTSDYIPRARPAKDIQEIYSDSFVELLGWIITDGNINKKTGQVSISQDREVNKNKCIRIQELLEDSGMSFGVYERPARINRFSGGLSHENTYNIHKEDGEVISSIIPSKALTIDLIDSLSVRQKKILINGLIGGDGSSHQDNYDDQIHNGRRFSTHREADVALMSILLAQAGLSFSYKTYKEPDIPTPRSDSDRYCDIEHRFEIQTRAFWRYAKHKPQIIDYDGFVWCPTTDNNTILIKREGLTTWTGNSPVQDFIKPMIYRATQRSPWTATAGMAVVGSMFGVKHEAKAVGALIGGTLGLAASSFGHLWKMFTGERYMPSERRKELALDEYVDILSYTKAMRGMKQAQAMGDMDLAQRYSKEAQKTMYGADIYNGDLSTLAQAIPRRKREHFREMVNATGREREDILSTASRLERRIYQAAWGMPVEERPDLEEYFSKHELPGPTFEGWHPNTNMEHVKIKLGQSWGLDMAQMGYFPQQIREANIVNPSYPDFTLTDRNRNVEAQLRLLMEQNGFHGDVIAVQTPYPGTDLRIDLGV